MNRSIYRVAPCIIGKCEGKRLASLCLGRIMDIFNHLPFTIMQENVYIMRENVVGQSSEECERMLQLVVQSHRLDTHEHVYIFICSLPLFTLRELALMKDAKYTVSFNCISDKKPII